MPRKRIKESSGGFSKLVGDSGSNGRRMASFSMVWRPLRIMISIGFYHASLGWVYQSRVGMVECGYGRKISDGSGPVRAFGPICGPHENGNWI